MLSTDFIFRQQENLVDNQKCQAGFRPLCNCGGSGKSDFEKFSKSLLQWPHHYSPPQMKLSNYFKDKDRMELL